MPGTRPLRSSVPLRTLLMLRVPRPLSISFDQPETESEEMISCLALSRVQDLSAIDLRERSVATGVLHHLRSGHPAALMHRHLMTRAERTRPAPEISAADANRLPRADRSCFTSRPAIK